MSTAVVTVRAHPDKYKKDFDAVVAFLTLYTNERSPTPSVRVSRVMQARPAKWQKTDASYDTFRGKIELMKNSREKYDLMSMAQHKQSLQEGGTCLR